MKRSSQELDSRQARRHSQMHASTSKKSFQLEPVSSSNGPKSKYRLRAVRREPSKNRLSSKESNPLATTTADYQQQFPSLAAHYRSTSRSRRSNHSIEVLLRSHGKALKHSLRFKRIHPQHISTNFIARNNLDSAKSSAHRLRRKRSSKSGSRSKSGSKSPSGQKIVQESNLDI